MRTYITLAAALIGFVASAQQQQQPVARPTTIGGGLDVVIPLGEFDDTWGRQLVGLGANMAIPMRRLPFSWGADFGWARMGSKSQEVPVQEENIASTTGELEVKSNMYSYHGMVRLQPFTGKVSPYGELMAGVRHFTTRTEITVEGLDQPIMEQRNENDFIGSVGWAAGLQVLPGKSRNFYVETRVERLNGGQITYVDPASIKVSQTGDVSYRTLTSGSNVVNITFGIGLRF